MKRILVVFISLLTLSTSVPALQIQPESEIGGIIQTLTPRQWWWRWIDGVAYSSMDNFAYPEHERIAQQVYGCPTTADCDKTTTGYPFAPAAVVAGSRWNDNPPFELTKTSMRECTGRTIALPNFAKCWYTLFRDGEKQVKSGASLDLKSGAVVMLRSHFGDLQFLHSMASNDKERAGETRDKILMWFEFTWRTARGEFTNGTRVSETQVPGLADYFKPGETVQTLFTRGNPTHRKDIGNVAFGSLLHTLHDSFTRSHTDRDEADGSTCGEQLPQRPGRVRQFLSYPLQDSSKHKIEDMRDAADLHLQTVSPNMVEASRYLEERLEQKATWDEIKPVMSCLFDLEDENAETGPGAYGI